jgi:hypothetical protein
MNVMPRDRAQLIDDAGLVAIGVAVNPCLHGVAVLRAGDAKGNEGSIAA